MITIKSLKSLALSAHLKYYGSDQQVNNIVFNSKLVQPGDLFVAIKAIRDGHAFISEAISRGACAILVSDTKYILKDNVSTIFALDAINGLKRLAQKKRQTLTLPVIAITGSCGKTTTKEIIKHVLSNFGVVHATLGNLNNHIGVPITILQTPENADFLVIEAGTSSAGEIKYLGDIIQADIAVITNIGASHLEKLKTLKGVYDEKKALFDTVSDKGCVIINGNDSYLSRYKNKTVDRIVCGTSHDSDIILSSASSTIHGVNLLLTTDSTSYAVRSNMMGQHNAMNILLSCGVFKALNINISKALQSIEQILPYQGRMKGYNLDDHIYIIDDTYNASANATQSAIQTLSDLKGINIAVLGTMGELGDLESYYHTQLGKWCEHLDYVYFFGDKILLDNIKKSCSSGLYYYKKKPLITQLINDVKRIQSSLDTNKKINILFKGSRSSAMEEVLNAFASWYKDNQ